MEDGEEARGMEERSVRFEALEETRWWRAWVTGSSVSPEPFRDGASDAGDATSLSEDMLLSSDVTPGVARDDEPCCEADCDAASAASVLSV